MSRSSTLLNTSTSSNTKMASFSTYKNNTKNQPSPPAKKVIFFFFFFKKKKRFSHYIIIFFFFLRHRGVFPVILRYQTLLKKHGNVTNTNRRYQSTMEKRSSNKRYHHSIHRYSKKR
jgi:hypothetical protein